MDNLKDNCGPFWPLVLEIKTRAEQHPYVDVFWINGSRGAGRHVEKSDLDCTVLVKAEEYVDGFRQALDDLLEDGQHPGFYPEQVWSVTHWKEGPRDWLTGVSLSVGPTEAMLQACANLFDNTPEPYQGAFDIRHREPYMDTHFLSHQGLGNEFLYGVPVYDPSGYFAQCRALVLQYPDDLSQAIVERFVGYLEIRLEWMLDRAVPRNKFNFISDIREVVYYIALAHYAKNKRFMEPGLKHYHYDLEVLQPDIRAELDCLLAIDDHFEQERGNKSLYLRQIIDKLKA